MVKSSDGALVYWDGNQDLMITVPETFKSSPDGHRLYGLCGTYDDNPENDFVDMLGNKVERVEAFPDKWLDEISCSSPANPPPSCYSPTGNEQEGMLHAQRECEIIMNTVFAPCHSVVPPEQYKLMCMADVCACNSTLRADCKCKALSLYARVCHMDHNVKLNWRSSMLCRKYRLTDVRSVDILP